MALACYHLHHSLFSSRNSFSLWKDEYNRKSIEIDPNFQFYDNFRFITQRPELDTKVVIQWYLFFRILLIITCYYVCADVIAIRFPPIKAFLFGLAVRFQSEFDWFWFTSNRNRNHFGIGSGKETKTESRTIEIGYGVEKWQKSSKFWNRWISFGILFFIDKEKRICRFNSIQYFGFQHIFSSYSQTDTVDCVWRISHCNYWSLSIYVSSPTLENGFLIKTLPIFLFMIYD